MGRVGFPSQFTPLTNNNVITDVWHRYFQDAYKFSGLDAEQFPLYQDCVSSPSAMVPDPVNTPMFSALTGGVMTYAFSASALNALHFSVQLPHGYLPNSPITPFVQWCPPDNAAGSVAWGLEYTWGGIGGALPTAQALTVSSAAPTVALQQTYAEFSAIDPKSLPTEQQNKSISSVFFARIYRDGAASGDTYPANAFLLSCGVHFQNAAHGTVKPWP